MSWWKNLNPVKNKIVIREEIFNGIKGKIRLAEPLEEHATFKIGGPAKFFIEPKDLNNLKLSLGLVKKYNLAIFVIGRGSNLLISDKGINGVVLRLNTPYFKKLSYRDNYLNVGSGVLLNTVVLFAKEHGLSGAEFLAGIPGTVGGALAMNAGISEKVHSSEFIVHSIGDLIENVTVMDYAGNIKTLDKKDIKFSYRKSSLSKYIILSALIKLSRKNKEEIGNKIKAYLRYRKLTQDLSKPSCGCIFRNPAGHSAGRLIDLCGLKGKRIGGAGVSLKHANFILNLGKGSFRDICKLMDLIKKEVREKFNIDLKPEIKIWQ
ncbi:MAG: UDP-N-acetylmuramate dehydrogenase [Candidatus Omnitrophota bacterium]|nr:UDP-N-acetylmuramate dehydrogenase [Candidatus Omnitrophota bacterium]